MPHRLRGLAVCFHEQELAEAPDQTGAITALRPILPLERQAGDPGRTQEALGMVDTQDQAPHVHFHTRTCS